jgi:ubiquinone/menaquinone biosynthesis C-methylase UbiE
MLVALRPPVRFNRPQPKPDQEYAFLERRFTPRTVFMEIGGADCRLALRAASYVERVHAVDVSGQFIHHVLMPCNLRLVLCDGVHLPVPEASVDVAWSGAFMDQLIADDAREHLQSVRRSLAPGGEYLCRTRGEPRELCKRFLEAGFSAVRCYAGGVRVPGAMAELVPLGRLRFAASK